MSYFAVIREAGPGRPARTEVSRIDCPLAVRPAASPHGRRVRRSVCTAPRRRRNGPEHGSRHTAST